MGFFDAYPRFYDTSKTYGTPNRLNGRWTVLIERNKDIISGHSVLDLASHDGRWSFAAAKAGASRVHGIEGRQYLVDRALETFAMYGVDDQTYSFEVGDIFFHMRELSPRSFDTVFCFGMFYHTMHHMLLLSEIARLRPRHMIMDTNVTPSGDPVIHVREEGAAERDSPFETLVGWPSTIALELMLNKSGFALNFLDWHAEGIQDWRGLEDYRDGLRLTIRAQLRDG